MKKIKNICHCWTKTFNFVLFKKNDLFQKLLFTLGVKAALKELTKYKLIVFIFINIRNSKFWFPVKRMGCTNENLLLFCNAIKDKFKRRIFEIIPKVFSFYFFDNV